MISRTPLANSIGFVLAVILVLASCPVFPDDRIKGLDFKHGISFFHDLKYPSNFTHLDYLNPDAPKGGTIVEATALDFNTLSPASTGAVGAPGFFGLINDTLIIRAGDEVSGFYGRLADGIAVSEDQRILVFRIHPRAHWHDGTPITTEDVRFTLELGLSQVDGDLWFGFIESIEIIDDRHIALHLKNTLTLNNIIIIQFTPIISSRYWTEHDPTKTTLVPPQGGGPYRVTSVKQGKYIEYSRVADYWGRDIPVNRGRYNFDTHRYEVYRDATITREALRKGLIDYWTEQDVRYWHSAFDTPALEKGWLKKIRRNFGIEIGVRRGISFNNRLPKFKDRRVRQALSLAMDFEWQNRTLHYGYRQRAHSHWPDSGLAANGLPSEGELKLLAPFKSELPSALFEQEFRFPINTSSDRHRAQMLKARELMREAGWFIDSDGILKNASGEEYELNFLSQSPEDYRILLPYIVQLKLLGIKGNLQLVESSQYSYRLRNFDFDALLRNLDILQPPVIEFSSTYHSDSAMQPLSRNVSGIADPIVDHLVEAANLATTMEDMISACRALDRVLLWQFYQIPLYTVERPRTVHWDKFGKPDFEPEYWPAFPDGWWFDEALAARIKIND